MVKSFKIFMNLRTKQNTQMSKQLTKEQLTQEQLDLAKILYDRRIAGSLTICMELAIKLSHQGIATIQDLSGVSIEEIMKITELNLIQSRKLFSAAGGSSETSALALAPAPALASAPDQPNASFAKAPVAVREVVSEKVLSQKNPNVSSARLPVAAQEVKQEVVGEKKKPTASSAKAPEALQEVLSEEVASGKKPNVSSAKAPKALQEVKRKEVASGKKEIVLSEKDYPPLSAQKSSVGKLESSASSGFLDELDLFAETHCNTAASGGSTKSQVSSKDKFTQNSSERRKADDASGGGVQSNQSVGHCALASSALSTFSRLGKSSKVAASEKIEKCNVNDDPNYSLSPHEEDGVAAEEEPRHANIRDALVSGCPDAKLNILLGDSGFPKSDTSTSTSHKVGGITKFTLRSKPIDSSTSSEITSLKKEIDSLTTQIGEISKKHKLHTERAKHQGKEADQTVVHLLKQMLDEKNPFEQSLKSKKETLKELRKSLPKSIDLSAEELARYSEIMDGTNRNIVLKVAKPYWDIVKGLRQSHVGLSKLKSKAVEAVDGSNADEAVSAGDEKKGDKRKFAKATVYPGMEHVPEKNPRLKREEVILIDDVDHFLKLLELIDNIPGFTKILSVFSEVVKEPAQQSVQKPHRMFVQFTRLMNCDDVFPSEVDLRSALLYIVDALKHYKNATSHAELSLNDALSRENFQRVFLDSKPKFKKPSTSMRAQQKDLFESECQFARAAAGGGAAAERKIEDLVPSFHKSMQGVPKSGLALIGNMSMRTPDQWNLYHAIGEHSAVKDSGLTTAKFLESSGVIRIDVDEKGGKTFTVLPLPSDD